MGKKTQMTPQEFACGLVEEIDARLVVLKQVINEEDVEVDPEELLNLTTGAGAKPTAGLPDKKKPAKDEEEDEPVAKKSKKDDEEKAGEVEYDPKPFTKQSAKVAAGIMEDVTVGKSEKETIKQYLDSAPQDAPATREIQEAYAAKDYETAYTKICELLVDGEGEFREWGQPYMRGDGFLYCDGQECAVIVSTGDDCSEYGIVSGSPTININTGEVDEKPDLSDAEVVMVIHSALTDKFFGLINETDAIEVEKIEKKKPKPAAAAKKPSASPPPKKKK